MTQTDHARDLTTEPLTTRQRLEVVVLDNLPNRCCEDWRTCPYDQHEAGQLVDALLAAGWTPPDAVLAYTHGSPVPTVIAGADPHTADLVLASTAITPGRRYWTCARTGHSIDPIDFVHTAGPCPDDTASVAP